MVSNVIGAIASLIIPGLGQLLQGRFIPAVVHFLLAMLFWGGMFFGVPLGIILHIYSSLNAARHKDPVLAV